jgi:hypothetical protein
MKTLDTRLLRIGAAFGGREVAQVAATVAAELGVTPGAVLAGAEAIARGAAIAGVTPEEFVAASLGSTVAAVVAEVAAVRTELEAI